MATARRFPAAAALGGQLYVAGGTGHHPEKISISSCVAFFEARTLLFTPLLNPLLLPPPPLLVLLLHGIRVRLQHRHNRLGRRLLPHSPAQWQPPPPLA